MQRESAVNRKEDFRLITGRGRFLDDIRLEGLLFAGFIRNPFGHARIKSITKVSEPTCSDKSSMVALITGEDIDNTLPMILTWPGTPQPPYYLLAKGEALYAGQPVVAIACDDRSTIEDALDSIQVEFEALPAVIDAEKALKPGSDIIHSHLDSNLVGTWSAKIGDFESIAKNADVVLEEKFTSQRVTGQAIEPRGSVAVYSPESGKLTLYSTTQCPHMDRTLLSDSLRIPEDKIRVIADDVGGGFGVNSHLHVEQILTCILSIRTGRPVKWVEDRKEHVQGSIHSGDFIQYITLAAKRDGTLLGIKDRIIQNAGAYLHSRHVVSALVLAHLVMGPYKVPNYSVEMKAVFSNKGPVGTYRAYGMTNASFARERMIDILAWKLRLDPAEIRLKNFIGRNEFPYSTGTGLVYDSGDYESTFRKALSLFDYSELRRQIGIGNSLQDNRKKQGIGIGVFLEEGAVGGLAPFSSAGRYRSEEPVLIRLNRSGTATIFSAVGPSGQGHETTLAQILAIEFQIPIERVKVVHGDTDSCPYGPNGSVASRSINMAGNAVVIAARMLLKRLHTLASEYLGVDSSSVMYKGGVFYSDRDRSKGVSFDDLLQSLDDSQVLEEIGVYEPKVKSGTTAFGVELALAEVDTETGLVKIRKMVIVHDCGRMINAKVVEGISQGGVAQGIGAALLEEIKYGEDGELTGNTLADYLLPTSLDLPDVKADHTETPSPTNPLGVKGGGESGIIGGPAAVVNAIYDALKSSDIVLTSLPISPSMLSSSIRASRTL